jgi:hypothetical protein
MASKTPVVVARRFSFYGCRKEQPPNQGLSRAATSSRDGATSTQGDSMGQFYFDATANASRQFIRDLPMYAMHAGQSFTGGWDTAKADSFIAFQNIMWKVNVQVPVHLAMPGTFADQHFTKGTEFSKLVIYAYRPLASASRQSDGGYRVGSTIAMVLSETRRIPLLRLPFSPRKAIPSTPTTEIRGQGEDRREHLHDLPRGCAMG